VSERPRVARKSERRHMAGKVALAADVVPMAGLAQIAGLVPMAGLAPIAGVVASFDEARGLGEVATDEGGVFPFHCTAILDGTRAIEAGARVVLVLRTGHLGRVEAGSILKIAGD